MLEHADTFPFLKHIEALKNVKCTFLNENVRISPKKSLKFVSKVRINTIPALIHLMQWRRPGSKPLPEPIIVILLAHICVTRPQ